jgi:hypothetical protein
MIPKSGYRFSEKIMRHEYASAGGTVQGLARHRKGEDPR